MSNISNNLFNIDCHSTERPISPVLGLGTNKRRKRRNPGISNENRTQDAFSLNENSFRPSQNRDVVQRLEELETIDNRRQNVHKAFAKQDDAKLTYKECEILEVPVPQITENLINPANFVPIPRLELKEFDGNSTFKAVSGKPITILQSSLNKQTALFDDILNCSPTTRINKHNYLNKSNSDLSGDEQKSNNKKHLLGDLFLPSPKKLKPCFNEIVIKDMSEEYLNSVPSTSTGGFTTIVAAAKKKQAPSCIGFQTAAFGKIKLSNQALKKAEAMYNSIKIEMDKENVSENVLDSRLDRKTSSADKSSSQSRGQSIEIKSDEPIIVLKETQNSLFPVKIENKTKLSNNELNKVQGIFDDFLQDDFHFKAPSCTGFQTAAFGKIELSNQALKKAEAMYKSVEKELDKDMVLDLKKSAKSSTKNLQVKSEEPMGELKETQNNFALKIESKNIISNDELNKVQDDFLDYGLENDFNFNALSCQGFQTAAFGKIKLSNKALKKAEAMFNSIEFQVEDEMKSVPLDEETFIKESNKSIPKALKNSYLAGITKCQTSGPSCCNFQTAANNTIIENQALRKVELVTFNSTELSNANLADPSKSITSIDEPIIETQNSLTPLNQCATKKTLGVSGCKLSKLNETKLQRARLLFEDENSSAEFMRKPFTSTPVRRNLAQKYDTLEETSLIDSALTPIKRSFRKLEETVQVKDCSIIFQAKGGELLSGLLEEKAILEERLKIINGRVALVRLHCCEMKSVQSKRQKNGLLWEAKTKNANKLSLRDFVAQEKPGTILGKTISNKILMEINPSNSTKITFTNEDLQFESSEGAFLVANSKNQMGLTEIEFAFKSMPGVDPRLLHPNWIENHYKWIVWKLASYERAFPNYFTNSLTLDNILLQLKYRYDREIDRAERSALRKIFEKDDVAGKRMVLCVATIKNVGFAHFELQLTDGWYSIRTVIDKPLASQVFTNKIKVGTKLITCAAEIFNCDAGVHPLDASDSIYLKINYNATRRALWHTKLGYQKMLAPFPIHLKTIHSDGGLIPCVRFFIARVFPVRFMERLDDHKTVWRNRKAEEYRAQEYESLVAKKAEELAELAWTELHAIKESSIAEKVVHGNIDEVDCAETLYGIMKNSKDPETFEKTLSDYQKSLVQSYMGDLHNEKQMQVMVKVQDDLASFKLKNRKVSALLQLIVMDHEEIKFNFSVWDPNDMHFQLLKEKRCIVAYNVQPRSKGDLSSNSKTIFRNVDAIVPAEFMSKLQRQLIQITSLFNEDDISDFDTVGMVVKIKIDEDCQEVWLADLTSKLLLVRINLSPSQCLILNNVTRRQVVSVCNLLFLKRHSDFVEAFGGFNTIFSSHSKYKHLQDGVELFNESLLEGNIGRLLEDCDNKIQLNTDNTSFSSLFENDDGTLVYDRTTSTDIAMSLMNIDKFL